MHQTTGSRTTDPTPSSKVRSKDYRAVSGAGRTGARKRDVALAVPGVRAVERSLAVLSSFTRERSERTLEGISESIGLPKSTTHRLLATLIAGGFVDRGLLPTTYRLGLKAAIVGSVALRTRRPREETHHVLESIRMEIDETIGLSVLDGRSIVIIDKVESRHALRWDLGIGASAPAHCTSSGKALLSGLPDTEIEALYGDGRLTAYTHNSIVSVTKLLTELASVRRRGFAIDDEELSYGVRCVAVPVRGRNGRIEFALAASGPSARLSPERLLQLVPRLQLASDEISLSLSLPDPDGAWRGG
jgi:IclR family KDG regulon transcriptional repressor